MGVEVVRLASKCHHESILASMDQLRLQGQLSDITVQVEYQGDVQEFRAHQVMLAASSGYFKNLLLSEDAARDKLSLFNMHVADFSAFLEFVYTGKVEVARDKIVDVLAAAQFLDCEELSEMCSRAMTGGSVQRRLTKTSEADEDGVRGALAAARRSKGRKQPKSAPLKRLLSPQSAETEGPSKRLKEKSGAESENIHGKKLKLKLAGHKVLQREIGVEREEDAMEENENVTDVGADEPAEKMDKGSLASSDVDDDGRYDMDVPINDMEDSLGEEEEEEEEGEEEDGQDRSMSKRTSKAQFQCNKCQRTFHYERSYLKHISTYHGVKAEVVYRCETCQQTFANRSNLKIHEKHVHNNERLFSCEACAKTFKRKKDVVRHHRQVHERNSLRHVCPECGKSLSSKTALMLHERTHTGAKPFECTECGARFTQNSALKMHHRIHTGEKPFACDECDARFTQKHMLSYHKRSHTGEKPFMCEACGKSFASKEYLRHHSNIHTGSKPYKCELCGRGFAQRNSLHQHSKIHTGERPYSCQDCSKQFTQLNALQRHQRIHTGEKPYMCGLCTRTFTDKSTLRRHTMIHDSDAPWKTYLVVLEGNVEDKRPKDAQTKGKTEKAATAQKKGAGKKSGGGDSSAAAGTDSGADPAPAPEPVKAPGDSIILPEPVALPPDWSSHGAIALVSHGALGGITVIHTEVPAGTQLQPIVTTDASGASVLALDSSAIPVPFSIPVSMAHPLPMPADAASASAAAALSLPVTVPALSLPVSDSTLALVSETPVVSTSSVLETAATQTILAPDAGSQAAPGAETTHPDIETVIVGEQVATVKGDGQERTAETPLPKPNEASNEDSQQDCV